MSTVAWPIRTAASSRHLEDADGTPFRVQVDSAWFASTEFWLDDPESAAAFEHYLSDRAAKGFTGILMMGMVQDGYNSYHNIEAGDYAHLPANRVSGAQPLEQPGDFSTPRREYWANVRDLILAARRHGIAVLLAYNYLGYQGSHSDQGWWNAISSDANSIESMRGFAQWLVDLLDDCDNIIWYPYGDMNPPPGEGSRRVRATIEAIRAAHPDAVLAAELDAPDDVIGDNADADQLLTVNSFYGFGPNDGGEVWRTADEAWSAMPPRPAWVCEPQYEGAEIGGSGTADDVREGLWWSVLGGGFAGQTFGRVGVYNFARHAGPWSPTWQDCLDSPGSQQVAVQHRYIGSLPWHELAPSGTSPVHLGVELVADGQGDGLRHIAAAGTPDGTVTVLYVPNRDERRSFAVDTSLLRGAARARWIDPVDGSSSDAGEVELGGPAAFETPGANAGGAWDWVLELRS